VKLTETHKSMILHALGSPKPKALKTTPLDEFFRNHYMLYEDSDGVVECDEMVTAGFMRKRKYPYAENGIIYHVTQSGLDALKESSDAPKS